MRQATVNPDLSHAGLWFAGLLGLAAITFWPTYVSLTPSANSAYTHFHAAIATLWVGLLIVQPLLIRSGRWQLHRAIGKVSWLIAPVFVIAVVLLAHSRIKGLEGMPYAIQTYILWLQVSLTVVFALSYVMAMVYRRETAVHARFMICTGLTLIDPVVVRLLLWVQNPPAWNYQWLTFTLTNLVILALIWLERRSPQGRWVFPSMLVVFVASQAPALFGLTQSGWWQAFAGWFAGLPLT